MIGYIRLIKNINMKIINNKQQNLRELARLTFLNLMSANGVMAKTIIRNYKQKQQRESYDGYKRIWSQKNLG